jgi:hypothetical protein
MLNITIKHFREILQFLWQGWQPTDQQSSNRLQLSSSQKEGEEKEKRKSSK